MAGAGSADLSAGGTRSGAVLCVGVTDTDHYRIAPMTRVLGFAGLLPQAAAVLFMTPVGQRWWHNVGTVAPAFALFYGAAILSFLGGIWWGFAVRRPAATQVSLALVAVVPSLVALLLIMAATYYPRWALVALGSAIMLTLLVDRYLANTGDAPMGWMKLREPLSIGLGALTIVVAQLSPGIATVT